MNDNQIPKVEESVSRFTQWLDRYGETSYDHQSFFASKVGRKAKALYYRKPALGKFAVAPMVLCEAFFPSARRFFWKRQRLPIADAHYAMGFAILAGMYGADNLYQRAKHFLDVLQETRCPGYDHFGWGYPFDWQTRTGIMKQGTPLITTVPYAYEAFALVHELDKDEKWLRVMRSIAEHAFKDYRDMEIGPNAASCGYTPAADDPCGVINASAYRACLLTQAARDLSDSRYLEAAKRNLNFVLGAQNADGSWYYSIDGERDFVDHFHTCFVLKALAKIEQLTGSAECHEAIDRGVRYYVKNLFDENRLPKPFSRAPRMTVYRRELYDYAECINLGVLLSGRNAEFDTTVSTVVSDVLERWQKPDGSYRARELFLGWDNVPMHRWAQSQLFRSFSLLLSRRPNRTHGNIPGSSGHLFESKALN